MIGRWRRGAGRQAQGGDERIVIDGLAKTTGGRGRGRILMTIAVFFCLYGAIAGRIAFLGMQELEEGGPGPSRVTASRPDILDRNGEVLATDINTASLYAEPRRIVDADEALEKLLTVLPDLNVEQTYNRLKSDAGFIWLRRQLSPRQQQAIKRPSASFKGDCNSEHGGGAE